MASRRLPGCGQFAEVRRLGTPSFGNLQNSRTHLAECGTAFCNGDQRRIRDSVGSAREKVGQLVSVGVSRRATHGV